jgi:hypothetical protein
MRLVCADADRQEIMETLINEGVTHQVVQAGSVRELASGSYTVFVIEANLPEVKVPPEYTQGGIGMRAFRLPSGRLIITDMEGNLGQIATPPPGK